MNRHIFLLLALLLTASPVLATSFVSRPLPETTQKTPTLVRGKIGTSYSDWVKFPDGGRRIYTFYEVQVSEVFKGEPKAGTTIQIREMGGEKDGVGLQVSGAAQFAPGEDVVLTLGEKNPDGSYDLRGLMTGKFGIGRDQSGNEILIGATGDDIEGTPDDHHGPWTLTEFRKLVASQTPVSHSETSPRPDSAINATSVPAATASASPKPATTAAPQLQPERDQGAAQTSGSGANWGYAIVAILVLGGCVVGLGARKKKK